MQRLSTHVFLEKSDIWPIVDVRSPREYDEGHIYGAINLPLFDDDERAMVGITYKESGKLTAIDKGLEIVGPKMSQLASRAKIIAANKKIGVYCWRGGMRSEKMAWLFELVGLETIVLEGGYKAYRNQLLTDFNNLDKLIILQGATGSGKTAILHELNELGEQIIDLEGLANHKGSAFGHIGMGQQPSSAQFQNNLYHALLQLDFGRRIWIESESITIGRVYLPDALWNNMNHSQVFDLNIDKTIRAQRLVEEYGQYDHHELARAIHKITHRFGGNRVQESIKLLDSGNLYETAMLLLDYYDKSYRHSREKYKDPDLICPLVSDTGSPERNARMLIAKADEMRL